MQPRTTQQPPIQEGESLLPPSPRPRRTASIHTGSSFLPHVPASRTISKVSSWPNRAAQDTIAASRDQAAAAAAAESVTVAVAQGQVPQALAGPAVLRSRLKDTKADAELNSGPVLQPPPVSPKSTSQLPPMAVPVAANTGTKLTSPRPAAPAADRAGAPVAAAPVPAPPVAAAAASTAQPARPSWWTTISKGGRLYSRIQQAAAGLERGSSLLLPQVRQHEHHHQQQRMRARMEAERAWGLWGQVHQQQKSRQEQQSMASPFQQTLRHSVRAHPGPRAPRISLQQLEELMEELQQKRDELEDNILADPDDPSPADTRALVEVKMKLAKVAGMHQQERERQRLQQMGGKQQEMHQQVQEEQQEQEQPLQLRHHSSSCSKRSEGKESPRASSSPFGRTSSPAGAMYPQDSADLNLIEGHQVPHVSRTSWPSYTAAASAYATLAAQLSGQLPQPPAGASSPTAVHVGAQPWVRASALLPTVPSQPYSVGAKPLQSLEAPQPCSMGAPPSVLPSSSGCKPPSFSPPSPGLRVFRGLVLPQPVCQIGSGQSTDLMSPFPVHRRFNRL